MMSDLCFVLLSYISAMDLPTILYITLDYHMVYYLYSLLHTVIQCKCVIRYNNYAFYIRPLCHQCKLQKVISTRACMHAQIATPDLVPLCTC